MFLISHCIDPDCLLNLDLTSMRAVVRLDHDREVPEQLLVRNHSGPASIARVHTIRTWLDANPMPEFSHCTFGPVPALHTPPIYESFRWSVSGLISPASTSLL